MPKVGTKTFPYTAKGEAAAKVTAKKTGKKLVVKPAKKATGKKAAISQKKRLTGTL